MNKAQSLVAETYCDGEFNYHNIENELDICGDGLFSFLINEVADFENEEDWEMVYMRLQRAVDQIQDVMAKVPL